MSNLLSHPKVLKKAQAEIDTEIGQENLIDEPNVLKLKYLQSIILEAQRLYTLQSHFYFHMCHLMIAP
ncbi:hypothetical protein Gogos_016407 [Gossypium gossypioides]|uniref:Cytochrome P450 n=1 Tax=Gossypium gossypioides TaxID=34282 RepID=A0A7J9B7M1_GOSGO|nr:hypothetical protein [Gossypium gossypioides]